MEGIGEADLFGGLLDEHAGEAEHFGGLVHLEAQEELVGGLMVESPEEAA